MKTGKPHKKFDNEANKRIFLYMFFGSMGAGALYAYFGLHTRALLIDLKTEDMFQYLLVFERWLIMFAGSLIQYFLMCSIVEYRNPMPKTPKRMKNIYREIRYGAMVLGFGSLFTLLWVQYVEPFCPYHGYYNDKPYGVYEFLKGFVQHFLYTTIGAFIIHRSFHFPFLYKWIHSVHHSFREPSAFGYCAAHPLEGVIEGTVLHHTYELFFPIHPTANMIYGLVLIVDEVFAHDGSTFMDFNDHYTHHLYYTANYGLRILDKLLGTVFDKKNYPKTYESVYLREYHKIKDDNDKEIKLEDHYLFRKYL